MKLYEGISTGLASIFQEKLRSALTMLGIVIGVAAVLAMLAIGDGAKRIVMQEFEKYGSHFTVRRNPWIWRGDRVFPNRSGEHLKYEDVLAIEAECPAVESVIPSISNEVLAQAEGGAAKWTEYDGVNSYFPIGMKWQIQQGRFFSEDEFNNRRKVCVLGLEVATELFGNQHPIGTEIKLSLQGGRPDRFRILGVMAERGTSLQYGFSWDDVVLIPLTTAQDRFKGKRHINYLNIRAVDSDSIEKAAEEVTAVLRKRHRNQDNFFDISFATAAVKELDKISRIIKIMLSSIAGFSLFVGSVGIMNMMLVSVNQRTREIGIRRAIGAKRRDIFLQFLIEAIVMCGIGGLFGIGLGIGTGYVCSYIAVTIVKVIPQWPVVISLYWIAVSVSISACIGIVFGLYPAIRASHISPIEALRTE
ncbi:MAG: ABC transporter permease [Candidatus Poribacteria bacterium]|nr:ABC transporter permease [Candidatus Poribacteria bacterium]